jgi:hypothetical protein
MSQYQTSTIPTPEERRVLHQCRLQVFYTENITKSGQGLESLGLRLGSSARERQAKLHRYQLIVAYF